MISYGRQKIENDDIEAIKEVLKSDFLTQGPKVLEFEKKLAEYCGAKYAVAVNNGTSALYLAYRASGLSADDEAITTSNSFIATSNMLLMLGAKPVFCDIRLDTYNIDEEKIESLITDKTKAIIPVHFAGHPCEMDKILQIAKKYKLKVIEDACHGLSAQYKNKKIGSLESDMAVFSFHPVKPITTGEGGAIVTDNEDYYKKLLKLRNHGVNKNKEDMRQYEGSWYYEMQELSQNYRITDIQCALGTSQLKKLNAFATEREKIANYYFDNLKNCEKIILPKIQNNIRHSWHLFVIRIKSKPRKEIFEKLKQAGIGVQVHYIPIYRQPYYRGIGYNLSLENMEKYYKTCLSLPIYPGLKKEEQDYIIKSLESFL